MPGRFIKPHIDISGRRIARDYQAPRENRGGGGAPRIREEHGRLLLAQLGTAFAGADQARPQDQRIDPPQGVYLEVELRRNEKPDKLERKSAGVQPGALKVEDNETRTVALYVPDEARQVLEQILQEYSDGPLTTVGQKPKNKDLVEPIESVRQARLETCGTDDPAALPRRPTRPGLESARCSTGPRAGERRPATLGIDPVRCSGRSVWTSCRVRMVPPGRFCRPRRGHLREESQRR